MVPVMLIYAYISLACN